MRFTAKFGSERVAHVVVEDSGLMRMVLMSRKLPQIQFSNVYHSVADALAAVEDIARDAIYRSGRKFSATVEWTEEDLSLTR